MAVLDKPPLRPPEHRGTVPARAARTVSSTPRSRARRATCVDGPPAKDPLLQLYRLAHLVMRNRLMSTAHEPAYSEDGMPKDRYRLDHVEKLREGSLRMTRSHAFRLGSKSVYVRSLAGLPFIRLADEPSLARRDLRTCKVAE